jgi:hypothetical protein
MSALAVTTALYAGPLWSPNTDLQLVAAVLIMRGTHIGRQLSDTDYTNYATGFIAETTGQSSQDLTPKLVDVPGQLWPATGLNSMTFDQSVAEGQRMLAEDIAAQPAGESIIVFGHSQSAVIASKEKQRLLDEYSNDPTTAPDVTFVLTANPDRPNGGLLARFPGLHIPIMGVTFNGATPTDQQGGPYQTYDVARQYDGWADFPAYPLNLVADANAVLGIAYLHGHYDDQVSPDMLENPELTDKSTYGDTTYYLIYTKNLPLLQPLRDLGVPEPLVAAIEPVVRYVVELGYDRQTPYGRPTPARFFPPINPHALVPGPSDASPVGLQQSTVAAEPQPSAVKTKPATTPAKGPEPAVTTDPVPKETQPKKTPRPVVRNPLRAVVSEIGKAQEPKSTPTDTTEPDHTDVTTKTSAPSETTSADKTGQDDKASASAGSAGGSE